MRKLSPLLLIFLFPAVFAVPSIDLYAPQHVVKDHSFHVQIVPHYIPSTGVQYQACVDVVKDRNIVSSSCTDWSENINNVPIDFELSTSYEGEHTIKARLLKNINGTSYLIATNEATIYSYDISGILEDIDDLYNQVSDLEEEVQVLEDEIADVNETLKSYVDDKIDEVYQNLDELKIELADLRSKMKSNLTEVWYKIDDLYNKYYEVKQSINDLENYVDQKLQELQFNITTVNETLYGEIQDVRNSIDKINQDLSAINDKLDNIYNELNEKIETKTQEIWQYIHNHENTWSRDTSLSADWVLNKIKEAIDSLKAEIMNAINNLVARVTGLEQKVNTLEKENEELKHRVEVLERMIAKMNHISTKQMEEIYRRYVACKIAKEKGESTYESVIYNTTMYCYIERGKCVCYYLT